PVLDAIRCLVFGMSMGSFMGLGHDAHHGLSGLLMPKHDARFRRCQDRLGYSCTKAFPEGEGTGWPLLTRLLPAMCHIFPVVEPHMARDQGPFAHPRPYPNNRMDSSNGHAWDVLVEPGSQLVAHEAHAFCPVGLGGEALDERI